MLLKVQTGKPTFKYGMTNHVSCQTSLGKSQDFYINYRPNKGQNGSVIDTANTPSKSGDELHKQPGDTREFKLFLTSHVPRLSNKTFLEHFSQKYGFFFISAIGGSEKCVLTAKSEFYKKFLPVLMDDGIEELAIFPAGGEVITPQAMVALYHPLRPQKQLFFGSHII